MRRLAIRFILLTTVLIFGCSGQQRTAEDYYVRGETKFKSEDLMGALNDLNKAIELDPDFPEAYNIRGNLKCALGDFKGALKDFDKAIALNPDEGIIYYNRGLLR
ncbi:MAG: tetratricopeptide repeat protein, partial [Perlabentimonas sp.]